MSQWRNGDEAPFLKGCRGQEVEKIAIRTSIHEQGRRWVQNALAGSGSVASLNAEKKTLMKHNFYTEHLQYTRFYAKSREYEAEIKQVCSLNSEHA